MAITNRCISRIMARVGEDKVTDKLLSDVESRIIRHRTDMARKDLTTYKGMTEAQQIEHAALKAMDEIEYESAKRIQRKQLNTVANYRQANKYNSYKVGRTSGGKVALQMLKDTYAYANGMERTWQKTMKEMMDAVPDKYMGLFHDKEMSVNITKEILGESSGNALAKQLAAKWNELTESIRQHANSVGADIGKLDYGYIPNSHDPVKMLKMGKDKWVSFTVDRIDRGRYLSETGGRLPDNEVAEMLMDVFDTITTGGLSKLDAGSPSFSTKGGGIAKRHDAHRALHFKDAATTIEYNNELGRGTLFQAMGQHITSMARDIALMEQWGPSASANFKQIETRAKINDGGLKAVAVGVSLENVWDVVAGLNHPYNVRAADFNNKIRAWNSTRLLGGAVISSVTDIGSMIGQATKNNIGIGPILRDFVSLPKADAEIVGFMAESLLNRTNRWMEGGGTDGIIQKMGDFTFRASLLNMWTDRLKEAYAISQSAALAKFSRVKWEGLDNSDKVMLSRNGVDEATWNIWNLATPAVGGRHTSLLNVDSVMAIEGIDPQVKRQAAYKLMGYIMEQSDSAVTSVNLEHKARLGAHKKGTLGGETARHLYQFKSFPLAMTSRMMDNLADIAAAKGKAKAGLWAAQQAVVMVGLGAMAIQGKSIIAGKDPEDMESGDFWKRAVIQSGGLGIFADIINTGIGGESRTGAANWMNLAGPTASLGVDLASVTLGNAGEAMRQMTGGKEVNTNMQAELTRIASNNIPAVKLWYTRAALDRFVFHELQEMSSPGYLDSKRARDEARTGAQYWWDLGAGLPDRAPNLEAAVGGGE